MRKLLLTFLSVMAFAGMTVAQDIYGSGYYTPSGESYTKAALYKNGSKLYEYGPSSSYNYISTSVDYFNGNVYWTSNATNKSTGNPASGKVFKNGTSYLSLESGGGSIVNKVIVNKSTGTVGTVGSMPYGDVRTAVLWTGTSATPTRVYGTSNHDSEAISAFWGNDGNVYACGYQYTSSSTYHGVIWHGNTIAYSFPDGTKILDMVYHDGSIYSVGLAVEGGQTNLKVWRNSNELYTLSTNGYDPSPYRYKIYADAGDIYVNGQDGTPDKIWKNGTELYSTNTYFTSVVANTNGVYYAGSSSGGTIWKDGSVLYSPSNCTRIMDLSIPEPECQSTDVVSLPFFEGFENGETSWPCWTKLDVDNNNGNDYGYWKRRGNSNSEHVATGNYSAYHSWEESAQEGWLISPRLFLQPGRDNTTLTFKTREAAIGHYNYEGVWVSTNSNPASTGSYTQVWTQSNPTESWETVTVDLSAYQGQAVYIGFKYASTDGHVWFIDDISVTESWDPCSTQSVPYTFDFNNWNPNNTCWYIVDNDMSGGGYHWKYDETNQCAKHPWGPSGVAQYGCLVSPNINLASGHDYVLKFRHRNGSSGSNMSNKIYYKLDGTGIPNPDSYTSLLWTDANFPSDWTEVEIPLSSYAGHTISFSFEYHGTYAHAWYLDDVRVEEAIAQYTITANANNNAWGTVSGGGVYNAGETCTLTATPASGYQFQSWKKNGTVVSTNPNYSFTVTENATYTAYFGEIPINYYTITTNVTPTGAGTVTGGGTYQEGSTVTLTAVANSGYTFSQWQDGNTDNPRTITVTQNATYTATFTQDTYVITVYASPSNGGTVTGGGAYHYGETVTLTATPASNFEFQGWDDGVSDNPRQITVTGNASYTAIFSEAGAVYYTITTNVNPEGAGTVTGGGTYEEGTAVTLTATANAGYTFSHWNDGSTQNPRSITVTSSMSFTAYFNQNMYTITVVANPSNGGTVSGGGSYAYGTYATLMATPYSGYDFAGWSDGSSENPHQVLVTGNATYTATFSQGGATYYTVSAYVSPAGSGTVTGTGTYQAGATCTLTAVANSGYTFDHWNDGNTQNPRTVTVNNNMSFTAYFNTQQYTITVNASPAAGGTVTGGGTYPYGATAILTATAAANYEFMQWSDGNVSNPRTVTVTGNATYTALFLTQGGEVFTVTVTPNSPFLGETFGSGIYPAGAVVEISAFPSPYAVFLQWEDGNTDNPRTITVNSDMEFVAVFGVAHEYTITVVSADENMGQAYGGGSFMEGTDIQISAMAYGGYEFQRWNDGNTDNPRTVRVTGDATYTAYFIENTVVTHTLTLICNTAEGTVSGGGVYVHGTTATIQAFPNEGFSFSKWSDENTDNPRLIVVDSDMTLVAFFGTGIDENEQANYIVYPNPAKATIRVLGIEANSEMQIFNVLGEMVQTVNAGPDDDIDVSRLADGLYTLRCGNVSLRFVKTR